ncbi:hypothetical protein Tco_0966347 [Tanacetum coccineum]
MHPLFPSLLIPLREILEMRLTLVWMLSTQYPSLQFHEHLQGVPIKEDMSTLRFRMGMAEAESASLCGKIRTMEAIETVTHSQERRACIELERQLASVQESQ